MSAVESRSVAGFGRFDGGGRLMTMAGAVGVLGLLASLVGLFVGDTQRGAHGYLVGFMYWAGIAMASVILLAILHTMRAKWSTVLRRALEVQGFTVILFAVLMLPLFLVLPKLFPWMHHAEDLFAQGLISEEQVHHLHHKQHGYLNLPFFTVRQVVYFAAFFGIAFLLLKWSRRQDEDGALEHTVRLRKLGPGSLPLLALCVTFFSFDWLMSLTPLWQSTIFGVYYFIGGLLSAIALWTLFSLNAKGPNAYGELVNVEHWHNLGKLMLAFTAFWAYIAFSQFLLVWAANLPEEAPYYWARLNGPWKNFTYALWISHFLVPFFVLLSRDLKRTRKGLAFMSVYILVVHFLDIVWLIVPSRYPGGFSLHWTDFAAVVGIGGLSVAFGAWRMRGGYSVPVKDPYLSDSLRYVQP